MPVLHQLQMFAKQQTNIIFIPNWEILPVSLIKALFLACSITDFTFFKEGIYYYSPKNVAANSRRLYYSGQSSLCSYITVAGVLKSL